MASFEHVAKRFVLHYPKEWRLLRQIKQGQVHYAVTPDPDVADIGKMQTGLDVTVVPITSEVTVVGSDPVSVLKYILPVIQRAEPGLRPVGAVAPARLGRLDAAAVTMEGTVKDKEGIFAGRLLLGIDGQHGCAVTTSAPRDRYAQMEPLFEQILRDSDFGLPRPTRADAGLSPSDLAERYKAAVVAITTEESTGSGVIISPDGYVLTNSHVIWSKRNKRPARQVFVEWDESHDHRKVEAQVVDWSDRQSRAVFLGGIDVALLKLPKGEYTAAPLTRLADVRLGDGVVAMGFPQRGMVTGISIFVTRGGVVRFNRNPRGHVESIFTTAKVAAGSSGGPCFSTATGGVIGLNTWRQAIVTTPGETDLNDMVGYYSVCTMEDIMAEFPLVTQLERDPTGEDLDFIEAYELSGLLMNQGTGKAARRLAQRAADLEPASAMARCRLGLTCILAGMSNSDQEALTAGGAALQSALACDPTHEDTLVLLARTSQEARDLPRALHYANQAAAAHSESWQAHQTRAEVNIALRRYDDAADDLAKAKKFSLGLLPQPFIISGMIQYALGNLDEGKADFEQACRIQPSNLQARLGVVEYLEHRKQHDAAIAGYERLLPEFRRHPEVLTRIGGCLRTLGRYEEAIACFEKAVSSAEFARRTPPAVALMELGHLAIDVRKDVKAAVRCFTRFLMYHPQTPLAPDAHMILAGLYGEKLAGISHAHMQRALALRPGDPDIKKALDKAGPAGLTAGNIVQLLNLDYPPVVVADLVRHAPMAFRLENETSVEHLSRRGIPPIVLVAIDQSNRSIALVPEGGGRDLRLVGKWRAPILGPRNAEVGGLWLEFNGAGDGWSFIRTRQVSAAAPAQDVGWWNADGSHVWGEDQSKTAWRYPYELAGDRLTVRCPPDQGGTVIFQRIRIAP